jgi:membrane-associated phospholipid phosphatase
MPTTMPTTGSITSHRVLRPLALLLSGWALVLGVMLLTGLLLTRVLADRWPLTDEDAATRALVSTRTPAGNDVTWVLSRLGDTWVVIGACAVAFVVLRLVLKRWRESIFVAACTVGQSAVFLLTTLVIDRRRPDVTKLDEAPPTSSFPSGHAGASLVLTLALAVVVQRRVERGWVRWLTTAGLLLIPVAVAIGRLYRGMHHPTDIAGSVLNAVLVLLVTAWVLSRTGSQNSSASGTNSA